MEDDSVDLSEMEDFNNPWRRQANLNIRSTRMPLFRKNKWIGVFLDLIHEDLGKLEWGTAEPDNLKSKERIAL